MAMRMIRHIVETGRFDLERYRSYLDLMNNRMRHGLTVEQQIASLRSRKEEFFTMGENGPVRTELNTPANMELLRDLLREGDHGL